jgi:HD-like signal output (HDOD) protein
MSAAETANTPQQFSRENLLKIARTLPADVSVLAKLGTMLQDPNSDLGDLSGLLRRDVALATRIVRISNSAVYASGGRVATIEDAVSRVGFGEILKLVGAATAARFTEQSLDIYGIPGKDLRNNMLYAALCTESLARHARIDPRVAYTAGLLRPLGIMVLDHACARSPAGVTHRYAPGLWPTYAAWEGSTLCLDSCEVAALILEDLGFPEDLTAAIRAHYLTRPQDYDCKLAALLNVSNGLAARVSYSFAGETAWWELSPEKLAAAGLSLDDFEPAIIETEAAFETAMAAVNG